jgi:hypothetical protein
VVQCWCHNRLRIVHGHLWCCRHRRKCICPMRCMHKAGIVRSRLVRIITFIFPVRRPKVVASVIVNRIQWRPVFEIIRRFILEGKSWDEAWRRWGYGAVDFFVSSPTQKKAASQEDSSSSQYTKWYPNTESNLLGLRESIIAR